MSLNLIYVSTNTSSLLTNDAKPYSALTSDPNNMMMKIMMLMIEVIGC